MFEAVPGQRGVVRFDVELHLLLQTVGKKERVDGFHVVIVLVFGGFARFRFDQDRAGKADLVFVLDHHPQETPELRLLLPQIRIEKRIVTLAAAPQHVVLSAEPFGQLDAMAHLGRREAKHIGIRIRCGAGHVAGMAE